MQFVLEHGKPEDRAIVVSKLRGQMLHMARHKFASNVCEKALTTADPESRRFLIEEIMTPRQDGVSPILTMMKDQFASKYATACLIVDFLNGPFPLQTTSYSEHCLWWREIRGRRWLPKSGPSSRICDDIRARIVSTS